MIKRLLLALMLLPSIMGMQAQNDNATALTVGSRRVLRGELAEAYRRVMIASNGEQHKIDAFIENYVDYLLKVEAAREMHIDTTQTFRSLVMSLPRTEVRSMMPEVGDVSLAMQNDDINRIMQYDSKQASTTEMVQLAHIFVKVHQRGQRNELQQAIRRIDSVYSALNRGADFEALARQVSDDDASAQRGGVMGWYGPHQLMKELEQTVLNLEKGKYSRPVLAPDGYHILMVRDRKKVSSFADLMAWRDDIAWRNDIRNGSAVSLPRERNNSKGGVPQETSAAGEMVIDRVACLQQTHPDIYEGLLLCALSEHSMVRQAANDEQAMARYFKKNKKQYRRKGFKPKTYHEVKGLVTADLYVEMEKHWVADLKQKYPVTINKEVVKTINKQF